MDMQIGGKFPKLPEAEDDALSIAFSRESFKKAVVEVRQERGIDPRTAKRLWARIRWKLLAHPQVKFTLSLPDLKPHFKPSVSKISRDFGLRWAFFYPSVPGHDWSFVQRLVHDDWGALQRSVIRNNFSRSPGTPAHTPGLTKDQQIFEKDLRAWVQQYSAVTADDIKKLRTACEIMNLCDVLLLEHLLFDKPIREWAFFSPKAAIGIEWGHTNGRHLYALVYKNTTIEAIKRQRDPRGRRFITAAARMVNPWRRTPRLRIVNCGDHLKVGPLPASGAYEVIVKLWPKIRLLQQQLPGLLKIRIKKNLGRDRTILAKKLAGKREGQIYREIGGAPQDGFPAFPTGNTDVMSEALRQAAYRRRKRLN